MTIKEKLINRGFEGNGKLDRECSKSEFEFLTGVSISNDMFSENEFGTQDAKVWITEEDGEEFKITVEINEEDFITHCYY